MAYQSIWYHTGLPKDIVNILDDYVSENFDSEMKDSELLGRHKDKNKRNSENAWIDTNHWIAGFIWHYVNKANRENFRYDLTNIDGENLQYTKYSEGQYYNWHNDAGISNYYKPQYVGNSGNFDDDPDNLQTTDFLKASCELVRKLSFTLQLSDPDEYEGGNVQLIDEAGRSYIAPRQRGTIILFDSRTQHRVIKVKKGVRKSIVGWVLGPRWKYDDRGRYN